MRWKMFFKMNSKLRKFVFLTLACVVFILIRRSFLNRPCENVPHKRAPYKYVPYGPFPCPQDYDHWQKPIISNGALLFVVTPTYSRPTQYSDMIRVGHSLMLAENVNIVWVVVEDSTEKTKLLQHIPIPHVHLLGPSPRNEPRNSARGRGVWSRNQALCWIRHHYTGTSQRGAIYFADDDNAYDQRLWKELEVNTRNVSVLPVGLISRFGLSTPIINMKTGKIVGFHEGWLGNRKFPMDTAGFSVDLQFLLARKNASWPSYGFGQTEDSFLRSLGVEIDDLVPLAKNCTELLVWHTRSIPKRKADRSNLKSVGKYWETNLPHFYDKMTF